MGPDSRSLDVCEAEREFVDCCGKLFDPNPFYSARGTCFSTKEKIVSGQAVITNSIRVMALANKTDAPSKKIA